MTGPSTLWVLTDGKAGDEQPLIGIAEAMGVAPIIRHLAPRAPFSWMMPYGPIDWRHRTGQPGSPLAPPFPDVCLAAGRRAVAYLRRLKRLSPGTCTVFFRDPRCYLHGADLLVVQAHDNLKGPGVLVVTTAPNRFAAARLAALRTSPPPNLAALSPPRVAVLVGGDSRHHRFTDDDTAHFTAGLADRLATGSSLMITISRRSPPPLRAALARLSQHPAVNLWDGSGENPYAAYLALADEVVVTADSTNMVGEAAVTGRPIQVFHPSGGHRKITRFLEILAEQATVGRFPEAPASGDYPPINPTEVIAAAVLAAWKALRTDRKGCSVSC